ncbi:hypothetical protein KP77_10060 [Jeotgalibacillus alimentarius]|uniref:Uncharacterized protein n=1 Tax=Jeotgalibacillus alimentarius TaxID=135826 RepID=A0A0C2SC41_9BACL|nr:hypothetical protein [Jeotgalibacillus alimentarius]KIL51494.1 hypothetical protein KP77_10060 [Jeotgalibacillus alimentarius]
MGVFFVILGFAIFVFGSVTPISDFITIPLFTVVTGFGLWLTYREKRRQIIEARTSKKQNTWLA